MLKLFMKKPKTMVSFNPVDKKFYQGDLAMQAGIKNKITRMAELNPGGLEMTNEKDAIKVDDSSIDKFRKYDDRNTEMFMPNNKLTDPVGLMRLLYRALKVMHSGCVLRRAVNMIPWDNVISSYPLVDQITMENKGERRMTFKDVPLDVNPDGKIVLNIETGKYDLLTLTTNLIIQIANGSIAVGEIINRQIWASMLRECDNEITISKSSIDQDLSTQISKMIGDRKPNTVVMHPITSSLFEKSPFLKRGHITAFTDMYVPTGVVYLFEREKMTVGDGLFVMKAYEEEIQMIKYINPNILDSVKKYDCVKIEIK